MIEHSYNWQNDFGSLKLKFQLDDQFYSSFFGVSISRADAQGESIHRRSEDGIIIFVNENFDGRPLNGKLWLKITNGGLKYIRADLEYGLSPHDQRLEGVVLELESGEVEIVEVNTVDPIGPAQKPLSDERFNNQVTSSSQGQSNVVFPFIDIQPWPQLKPEQQSDFFVSFTPLPKGTGSQLYYELEQAKTFESAYTNCISWINSSDFVSESNTLEGTISLFADLEALIDLTAPFQPDLLVEWVLTELSLESLDALKSYFQLDKYAEQKDLLWQSWFALTLVNGYHIEQLNQISATLRFAHFCETLCQIATKQLTTGNISFPWLQARDLLFSTFLMPAFPFLGASSATDNYIYPYSVGALKQIRHKLIGYAYGDLATVENVMKGERREQRKRVEEQQLSISEDQESRRRHSSSSSIDEETDLEKQALLNAAASSITYQYNKLDSTYGPPSAFQLNGSLTVTHAEKTPENALERSFAQKLINQSVEEMKSLVAQRRMSSRLSIHQEDTISSFDNSQGPTNLRSTYWWLNKVYRAEVVQYGSRMLVEFIVEKPAQWLVSQSLSKYGIDLQYPLAPEHFGIKSYSDIKYSTDMIPALTYYGIFKPDLMEDPKLTVSEILQPGEKASIAIPKGYEADTANVTFPTSDPSAKSSFFSGFIGRQAFDNSKQSWPKLSLDSETGSISASLILFADPGELTELETSKKADQTQHSQTSVLSKTKDNGTSKSKAYGSGKSSPASLLSDYSVNIEVSCKLTTQATVIRQVEIYELIQESYTQKKKAYYQQLNELEQSHKGLFGDGDTGMMKQSIQSAGLNLLMNLFTSKTGLDLSTDPGHSLGPAEVYEPVLSGFLNQAFEWNEMSFQCCEVVGPQSVNGFKDLATANNSGRNLSSFLLCDYARVLIPVQLGYEMKVNYFLKTGFIWMADSLNCPTLTSAQGVAYAIMQNRMNRTVTEEEESWLYEQPTSILVLGEQPLEELIIYKSSGS